MIDINGATLGITKHDGTEYNIEIDPIHANIDGIVSSTGVYELYNGTFSLGRIAFSLINAFEWIYDGDDLTEDEVDQVITFIQKDNDTLNSFFFKQPIDGVEHDYRITESEGHFVIEKDGAYLMEIQNNETWENISDTEVDDATFALVVNEIQKRYS